MGEGGMCTRRHIVTVGEKGSKSMARNDIVFIRDVNSLEVRKSINHQDLDQEHSSPREIETKRF